MNHFRPCNQRPMFHETQCPTVKTVCQICAECSIEEAKYFQDRQEEGKRQDQLWKQARKQYDRP